jgi:hypothetical protein
LCQQKNRTFSVLRRAVFISCILLQTNTAQFILHFTTFPPEKANFIFFTALKNRNARVYLRKKGDRAAPGSLLITALPATAAFPARRAGPR